LQVALLVGSERGSPRAEAPGGLSEFKGVPGGTQVSPGTPCSFNSRSTPVTRGRHSWEPLGPKRNLCCGSILVRDSALLVGSVLPQGGLGGPPGVGCGASSLGRRSTYRRSPRCARLPRFRRSHSRRAGLGTPE
jgi:hypothetical protein